MFCQEPGFLDRTNVDANDNPVGGAARMPGMMHNAD